MSHANLCICAIYKYNKYKVLIAFKKIVIEACRRYIFNKLIELKNRPNKSKGKGLEYNKLEMQTYLWSDKLTLKEAKLLFKIF